MRKAIVLTASGILAAAVVLVLPAGGQTTVQTIDGIAVVKNGKKPSPPPGAAVKPVLDLLFTIGGGDAPEQEFSDITAIAVRDDGALFLLDAKECTVKAFDAKGKFLFSFGKKGQGPGELNLPTGLTVTPAGEILVEDTINRRLAYFSGAGKFLRHQALTQALGLGGLVMDSRGRMAGRSLAVDGGKIGYAIQTFDQELKPVKTLARVELGELGRMKMDVLSGVAGILLAADGRGNVFVGSSKGYVIRVFDFDGRPVRTIERDYDPVPMPKEEREKMTKMLGEMPAAGAVDPKKMFEIPSHMPPYAYFTVNQDGRLLVQTYEKEKGPRDRVFDVFDADGRYIARVPLANGVIAWRGDRIFGIEENENGFEVLKVFRLRWEK